MLFVVDRKTKKSVEEKVFGGSLIKKFYGKNPLFSLCRDFVSRLNIVSSVVGFWQRQRFTKKNVAPFIQEFGIDESEFEQKTFSSFNDFFVRRLKKECRPIATSDAVIPADGRYRFFEKMDGEIFAKGQGFSLDELLGDKKLAATFRGGSCVIARLCPTDCHRFIFPVDGVANGPRLMNGPLYSVNPIALEKNIRYLTENKRYLTVIENKSFGKVLYLEVGATCVGSVHQTYKPGTGVIRGEEKGYFSFGGSCLIVLFLPGVIEFDPDLIELQAGGREVLCRFGESLGNVL